MNSFCIIREAEVRRAIVKDMWYPLRRSSAILCMHVVDIDRDQWRPRPRVVLRFHRNRHVKRMQAPRPRLQELTALHARILEFHSTRSRALQQEYDMTKVMAAFIYYDNMQTTMLILYLARISL